MRLPLLLCTVLLAACSSGASEQPAPSVAALPQATMNSLNSHLAKTMARNDVPGAAVEVCIPGYDNWRTAQGMADVDAQTPMSTKEVWPIRSVTKSVTVTLILHLVDQGKISLDDTIDQWVADVPNGDQITLRQLADMSSGAPEYTTEAWIDEYLKDPQRPFTTEELIGFAVAEPAQFDPGEQKVYTNTNTLLLGQVVEQEYGQPFAEVVQEQILTPLGMGNSAYHDDVNDWTGPTGYQQGEAQGNNFTVLGPAGAMTSTLDDLCAWGASLGQGSLLEPETQAARVQGQPLDKGPEYDFYGQGIGGLAGWVGHTGEGFGHTVLVMHNPDSGATAVVAMNISGTGKHVPTRYFRKIAPILDDVPTASPAAS
jgi:D-alanyl-D-alanine carboxypeptidase